MDVPRMTAAALAAAASLDALAELGPIVCVVDELADIRTLSLDLPLVVVAIGSAHAPPADADVLATSEAQVEALAAAVRANPQAATVLAQLLRATAELPVADALLMESFAYSVLQSGPEFAAWLAGHPTRAPQPDDVPLRVIDDLAGTTLVLDRATSANAIDTVLRAELTSTLLALAADDRPILLKSAGPHFSAGGDLREFGLAADPVTAHFTRTAPHIAAAMAAIAHRTTVQVHGGCIGAGLELAAFAHHVRANADTRFRLPEVSMGLMPGCGGTVSVTRRIGRHRTLQLCLDPTGIDAATAREWGLVDEVTT